MKTVRSFAAAYVSAWLLAVPLGLCSGAPGLAADDPFEIYHYHAIDDHLSTSGQITVEQIEALQETGFELVINLAVADPERNRDEAFRVAEAGIAYINIPVVWEAPTLADLRLFFDVMDARGDRRTLVHCFANYRASAFTYLYRTLRLGVDEARARQDLEVIWDDEARTQAAWWVDFIDAARAEFAGAGSL